MCIRDRTYSWGDVDVKIPGLVLVVQEISYDDEQDMEESYGKGNRPRGYGKGNYKASGKMSMLRDDYDDVLAYCKAKGVPFYGLEWPSVVVSYANEGERTRIDELKKVVPIKRSHKAAQGDKSLTVELCIRDRMMSPDGSDFRYAEDVRVKNKIIRETRKEGLLLLNDDIDLEDVQGELETRAKFMFVPLQRMIDAKEISSAEITVPEGQAETILEDDVIVQQMCIRDRSMRSPEPASSSSSPRRPRKTRSRARSL